jgi:Caspase domain
VKYHRRRAGGPCQTLSLAALLLLLLLLPAAGVERALRIVDKTGQEVGLYTASYALVIGVSEYTNGWPSLPGVADDVAAVAQVLTEQGFEVTVVQNPTSTGLRDAFDAFIHRYGLVPEHRLLIYFAGHGHTIKQSYGDEMGYLVPTNAPNPYQDKNGFLATAMDMQQIEVYAKRIQTKHVLFLFDSCFSGSIFSLSRAVPEHIHYKTSQPVRQFITGGRMSKCQTGVCFVSSSRQPCMAKRMPMAMAISRAQSWANF